MYRNKNYMRKLIFIITLFMAAVVSPYTAHAEKTYREVQIADPFIELRSGPGRGYPIFYVVDRNDWVKIIKRKNVWFKVQPRHGESGWVHMDQLLLTLTPEGERTQIKDIGRDEFTKRRSELGVMGGEFSGAQVITLYGGYIFTPNISSEIALSQALGSISSKTIVSARLMNQMFPEWSYSPFFALGIGNIKTEPHTTLVQSRDRSDLLAHAGIGVKKHLTKQLMVRAEYNKFVVFSSDDFNEDLREWKLGLAFFY